MADPYISPVKHDDQGQSSSNAETFTFRVEPSSVPVFITKLCLILDDNALRDMISWSNNGKRFCVFDIPGFSKVVLPQYFKHSNWPSFVRQLNMYGFHKVNDNYSARHGQLICEFHHPLFYRNGRLALRKIRRNSRRSTSTTVDPPQTQLPSIQHQKQHRRNHGRRCQNRLSSSDQPETSLSSSSLPLSGMPISSLVSSNGIGHIDDNTATVLNSIRSNETFDMDTMDDNRNSSKNLNDSNDRIIIGNSKNIVKPDNQHCTDTSFGGGDYININKNKGKRAADTMYDDDDPERNKNNGPNSISQLAEQYTEIRRQLNDLQSNTASLNSEMSFLKQCLAKQQESVAELLNYLSIIMEDSQSPRFKNQQQHQLALKTFQSRTDQEIFDPSNGKRRNHSDDGEESRLYHHYHHYYHHYHHRNCNGNNGKHEDLDGATYFGDTGTTKKGPNDISHKPKQSNESAKKDHHMHIHPLDNNRSTTLDNNKNNHHHHDNLYSSQSNPKNNDDGVDRTTTSIISPTSTTTELTSSTVSGTGRND
ncbi:unnamed protein product [Absidia cylindrospora]